MSSRRSRSLAIIVGLLAVSLALGARPVLGALRLAFGGLPSVDGLLLVRDGSLVWALPGGQRVLVQVADGTSAGSPVASPDGRRVLYTLTRGEYGDADWGGDLYLLDVPTSGSLVRPPRLLLGHAKPGEVVEAGDWAPDGRSVLLTYWEALYEKGSYAGTRSRVERLDVATGRREVLVPDASSPAWSPDGRRIAYARAQALWIARPDGGTPERVTGEGEFSALQGLDFSPDGDMLLFAGVRRDDLHGRIVVPETGRSWLDALRPGVARAHGVPWNLWVRAEGRSPRQLTRLGEDGLDAAWSPDGRRAAFVTDMGLYVIDAGGDGLEHVTLRADPRGLGWLRPRGR